LTDLPDNVTASSLLRSPGGAQFCHIDNRLGYVVPCTVNSSQHVTKALQNIWQDGYCHCYQLEISVKPDNVWYSTQSRSNYRQEHALTVGNHVLVWNIYTITHRIHRSQQHQEILLAWVDTGLRHISSNISKTL